MEVRQGIRAELGITEDQIVVLNIGRVVRDKGIFELLDAVSLAAVKHPSIICVLVGSNPALDETIKVQKKVDQNPNLKKRVKLLPSCSPEKVWEFLCAADIFAFPSHEEGMPNSLLEAMAMSLPSIAFGISPVLEIDGGTGCLISVPPLESALFSDAILRLSDSPGERARIGERGKLRVMSHFMARINMAKAVESLARVIQRRGPLTDQFASKRPAIVEP
jgi:glycosyltransferase involved in cell wall biosynthesis